MSETVTLWFIIFVITIWGGGVNYIAGLKRRHEQWNCFSFLFQVITSSFNGVLGALLSFEAKQSFFITLVIAALCSYSGNSSIRLMRLIITSKIRGK
ncbi:phage holin family protein [Enterobacter asburiae]|uniref:phage holin family protein n=1 Tax=Enterobacter asburiae TaxID=61645 RepID=UPI00192C603B|nr:phage holin family protein [Enterobacter asburiae]MBL5950223.1 phage holin family protein [Enterobacter asburiae]